MTKLTTYYDFADQVCYAFEGDREEDSRAIGQGTTPEDARADFWYQVNGSAAELYYSGAKGGWCLEQDSWFRCFDSREAAIAYADNHEWQAKSL